MCIRTSPLVSTTALIGLLRSPSAARAASAGAAEICCLRSGDAFKSTQSVPSRLTANDDCERAVKPGAPSRTERQFRRVQLPLRKTTPGSGPQNANEHAQISCHSLRCPGDLPDTLIGAQLASSAPHPIDLHQFLDHAGFNASCPLREAGSRTMRGAHILGQRSTLSPKWHLQYSVGTRRPCRAKPCRHH